MADSNIQMIESFKNLAKNISSFFDNNLLKKEDITCSELSVLGVICENEKMNVTDLANSLKISKSAVSQTLSKLEKKGYVKRKINLFDKKISYISLTENAKEKYEKKKEEYDSIINKVENQMGENDLKELSRLLAKLSDIIYDLGKDEVNA